jgi:hypothetical protein
MPIVRITEAEAEGGPLPPYCIHCGLDAVTRRKFRQANASFFENQYASLPVCERHNTAWPWPEWVFLACVIVPILTFIVAAMILNAPGLEKLGTFMAAGSVVVFLFAALVKLVYRVMQPQAVPLKGGDWQLNNIHENFCEDLEDCRDEADEFSRQRRRAWRAQNGETPDGDD